jgi:membrane protein DedA with SNARE-associated domain
MECFLEQLLNAAVSFADNSVALFVFLFLAGFANFFFPLVPIELVTVFCGYLVSQGHSSLATVISAPTLGMFAGSVLCYRISRYFGAPILEKPFFARFITDDGLRRTRNWLEKYGAVSLFFSKFVPGVYLCAVVSSGILALKESRIYMAFFACKPCALYAACFYWKDRRRTVARGVCLCRKNRRTGDYRNSACVHVYFSCSEISPQKKANKPLNSSTGTSETDNFPFYFFTLGFPESGV